MWEIPIPGGLPIGTTCHALKNFDWSFSGDRQRHPSSKKDCSLCLETCPQFASYGTNK